MHNIPVSNIYTPDGLAVDTVLESVGVTTNMYELPGDLQPEDHPGGLRLGSCALTSRGLFTDDFRSVARVVNKGIMVVKAAVLESNSNTGVLEFIKTNKILNNQLEDLKKEVMDISHNFMVPFRNSDI